MVKKHLSFFLIFIITLPSVLSAQDDKYSFFDASKISRLELLAIGYNDGLDLKIVERYLPWERSSNAFEDKRNKSTAMNSFKELADKPKFKKIAIFKFNKLPVKLSDYDFEDRRYGLCIPSTLKVWQDGASNMDFGIIPGFKKLRPSFSKPYIGDCKGPTVNNPGGEGLRISLGNAVALPMSTEQEAEKLFNLSQSNELFITVECIKDKTNDVRISGKLYLMTCSPYRIFLSTDTDQLVKINWANGELTYDYDF